MNKPRPMAKTDALVEIYKKDIDTPIQVASKMTKCCSSYAGDVKRWVKGGCVGPVKFRHTIHKSAYTARLTKLVAELEEEIEDLQSENENLHLENDTLYLRCERTMEPVVTSGYSAVRKSGDAVIQCPIKGLCKGDHSYCVRLKAWDKSQAEKSLKRRKREPETVGGGK